MAARGGGRSLYWQRPGHRRGSTSVADTVDNLNCLNISLLRFLEVSEKKPLSSLLDANQRDSQFTMLCKIIVANGYFSLSIL